MTGNYEASLWDKIHLSYGRNILNEYTNVDIVSARALISL